MAHRMIFIDITDKGKILRIGAIIGIDSKPIDRDSVKTIEELVKVALEKMGE